MLFKLNDWVCLNGTLNYPRMKIYRINPDGTYQCIGKNYRVSGKQRNIDKAFKEDDLEYWDDQSGSLQLRDVSTLR